MFPFAASTGAMEIEELLLKALLQLIVIIVAARVFAAIFRKFAQTAMVGDIAAGLILGPSCFGYFFPEASRAVFDPALAETFVVLSHVGLILLLFVVGLEFNFSHLRWHGRSALAIAFSGIVVPLLLVVMFMAALATSKIGIFAIFGEFLLGTVLSGETDFREVFGRHVRDFLTVFFLPIFYTYTGLRTNIGALNTWTHLALLLGVLACAVAGKLGGCWIAARTSGFPPRDSACIGALKNARGLMGLVVTNVGRDLGVIPDSVFCMLAIMSLATAVMTTPLLLNFMRHTEFEPFIRLSGFQHERPEETANVS